MNDLALLPALLAMPEAESLAVLEEIATTTQWLQPSVAELYQVPLEEWQAEHTRLFITGHPRTACPPFASAWQEGRMQGTALAELAGLYERTGFVPSVALPLDYLGTELEWLLGLLMVDDADSDERHEAVFSEGLAHLQSWIPRFANALQQESSLELYRVLGHKLEVLLA